MVGIPLFCKEGSGTHVFKILVKAQLDDFHMHFYFNIKFMNLASTPFKSMQDLAFVLHCYQDCITFLSHCLKEK